MKDPSPVSIGGSQSMKVMAAQQQAEVDPHSMQIYNSSSTGMMKQSHSSSTGASAASQVNQKFASVAGYSGGSHHAGKQQPQS